VLVLFQPDNYGFSVPLLFRSKAQCAGKGHSLVKRCNAAAEQQGNALRVSLSASLDGVTPLARGMTLAGEACLARNADTLTEPVIIRLKEY
jgi:hypothetical protein